MRRLFAVTAVIAAALAAVPAAAQFDSIFGGPPRPPASVPGGRQSMPTAPQQQPQAQQPYGAQPQQQPYGGSQPPNANVQSQPLAPPPAAAVAPANASANVAPLAPRPIRPPSQPADTSPQPGDQVIVEPPTQKIANPTALFSGLDKITGRIINFDVAIGETVQFGALQVTPRACYTRPATEAANTDAFVEVDEVTLQGEIKRIFTGWMFAASPGLNAVEHPIYDVWVTDCKGGAQTVAADKAADPPATPPPARAPTQARPKQAPQRQPAPSQQQPPGFPQYR